MGTVSNTWREANISAIFKEGKRSQSDPSNDRLVSLTSVVCKVVKKLMSMRASIMEHLIRTSYSVTDSTD